MKKIIFYITVFLLLAGCKRGVLVDGMDASHFIWINQSDHVVQFIANEYMDYNTGEEKLLFSKRLQKNEKVEYTQEGTTAYAPPPENVAFSSVILRFDDQMEVTYMGKVKEYPHGIISPPEGYPGAHGLFCEESYEKEVSTEGWNFLITWIYTFTNADYEAAREWAEKQ